MAQLKDSGARTTFEGGGQREILEGNGRHDLLPLNALAELFLYRGDIEDDASKFVHDALFDLHDFVYRGDLTFIYRTILGFVDVQYKGDIELAIRKVAIHYGDGAEKYGVRNWEKGLPLSSFLQSAIRHLIRWIEKWEDEPHDRAFLWNLLGMASTAMNGRPELLDLPYAQHTECKGEN